MSDTINQDDTTLQNDDRGLESVLDQFKDQLFLELGADKLSDADKIVMEEKLKKLINDRIINLVLIYLPEEKVAELDQIITAGDENAIAEYITMNIPGITDKIANELMQIREELIEKLKNE